MLRFAEIRQSAHSISVAKNFMASSLIGNEWSPFGRVSSGERDPANLPPAVPGMVVSWRRVLLVVIDRLAQHPSCVASAPKPSKQLIERYYGELWNQWRFEVIPELLSPDMVFRGSLGVDVKGHVGFRDYMLTVQAAFPDFHNGIDEILTENNGAAVRLTYRGTVSFPSA